MLVLFLFSFLFNIYLIFNNFDKIKRAIRRYINVNDSSSERIIKEEIHDILPILIIITLIIFFVPIIGNIILLIIIFSENIVNYILKLIN